MNMFSFSLPKLNCSWNIPLETVSYNTNLPLYRGHKQWGIRGAILGVVENPNLVKFIGYCAMDGE